MEENIFCPVALVKFKHFVWYYSEMLDDLETFRDAYKYPVLDVVISLLRDLSDQTFVISDDTHALFKQWKLEKGKKIKELIKKVKELEK